MNISERLVSKLKALPKRNDGYIFNPRVATHQATLYKTRKRLAKKLQKPELLQIKFHTLRHLFATIELYKEGRIQRDVQYMLGYKSSASTDRYTHYRPAEPTKYAVKRPQTKEEEDQLLLEGWSFIRYDGQHKEPIYRRPQKTC